MAETTLTSFCNWSAVSSERQCASWEEGSIGSHFHSAFLERKCYINKACRKEHKADVPSGKHQEYLVITAAVNKETSMSRHHALVKEARTLGFHRLRFKS